MLFTKARVKSTANMTVWSFVARTKKPIGLTRKTTFKGLIVKNDALNTVSIYRGRTTKSGLMFCSSPTPFGYNTKAGEAIYNAFKRSKRGI